MQSSFICILLIQNKPFFIAEQTMMHKNIFYEVKRLHKTVRRRGKATLDGDLKADQEGHDDVRYATRNDAIPIRIRLTS